jgi:hypothetical protein
MQAVSLDHSLIGFSGSVPMFRRALVLLLTVAAASACAAAAPAAGTAPPVPVATATCATPPREVLVIVMGEVELEPGASDRLQVFSSPEPTAFQALPPACTVRWAMDPDGRGSIDAGDGTVTVDADAAVGDTFEVQATLADGRVVTARVRVVRRGPGSMVGFYHEVSRVPCGGGTAQPPAHPIEELIFHGDGSFLVTWVTFDARHDYWGTYTFDETSGRLSLRMDAGNYLPVDFDGEGTVVFEGQTTVRLRDIWLGSSEAGPEERTCEHVFERWP